MTSPRRRIAVAGATVPLLLLALMVLASGARAEQLAGDVSARFIAITSNYTGAELVLFGTRQGQGEVVVVVRGPAQTDVVREKKRILGLWLNARSIVFEEVPGYYLVAATAPLDKMGPPRLWRELQVGVDNLALPAREVEDPARYAGFRAALLRAKIREGMYAGDIEPIEFQGRTLFRVSLTLPAHAPDGGYYATFYLVRGGEVVETRNTFFFINKTGFERTVFEFAVGNPASYGLVAILIAIAAGWFASVIFRSS